MFIGIAQHLTENKVQGKGRQEKNEESGFKRLENNAGSQNSSKYNCQCWDRQIVSNFKNYPSI